MSSSICGSRNDMDGSKLQTTQIPDTRSSRGNSSHPPMDKPKSARATPYQFNHISIPPMAIEPSEPRDNQAAVIRKLHAPNIPQLPSTN